MFDFHQVLSDLGFEPDFVDSDFSAYYSLSDQMGRQVQFSISNISSSINVCETRNNTPIFNFYSENLLAISATYDKEKKMNGLYIAFSYEKTDAAMQIKLQPSLEVNITFLAR